MKKKVYSVFATDSKFMYYIGVAIFSMLQHISTEADYKILILSEDLSDKAICFFSDLVRQYDNVMFEYIDVKEQLSSIGKENFHTGSYGIPITYRLFLPSLLPDVQKIMYFDSDIIFQDDVAKLWDYDLKGYAIGAVPDKNTSYFPFRRDQIDLYRYCRYTLKIKNSSVYFNSGVLVMDLDKLRAMNFPELVKREVMTKIPFRFVDQDILNRVFATGYLRLEKEWNHQLTPKNKPSPQDHIVHISGIHPWNSELKACSELWWFVAKQTDFYDKIKEISLENHLHYLEDIERKYIATIHSTCWKITKPIRMVMEFKAYIRYVFINKEEYIHD